MANILYLSNTGSIIGGCENQLIGLVRTLDRSVYSPIVVCPDKGEFFARLKTLDIPVYSCYFPAWRKGWAYTIRRLCAVRLAKLSSRHHIDLIHTSNLWSNYYAWRIGKALRLPTVSHVRDLLRPERIHKYLFDKFDRIIAISERTKAPLVSGGISSEKIDVIYNSIDLSEFSPGAGKADVLRQEHRLSRYLVALIGRIEPFKRQKEFVHIAAQVLKTRQDVSFLIIGDPVENQPGYCREVQKDIEKYSIAEHVVFTGYREDMPNIMPSLDLVVTLSAGSIVVEAMAAGRPVIGTDIGSASETIDNGVTGLLLPQDDIHAVSEAIMLLLHDGDMRARMGSAGRKRVEKLFDIQKTARATEAVYERLLSRTRLPAR